MLPPKSGLPDFSPSRLELKLQPLSFIEQCLLFSGKLVNIGRQLSDSSLQGELIPFLPISEILCCLPIPPPSE